MDGLESTESCEGETQRSHTTHRNDHGWLPLCEQIARETVLLCSGEPWRALAALLTAREYVMAAACFVCVCSRSPAWCERVHVPVLGSCTVCTGRPVPYVFCVCRCAMKNYFDPTGPFQ